MNKFLFWIRKKYNSNQMFVIYMMIGFVLSCATAVLTDLFFKNYSYMAMTLRAAIALVEGATLFCVVYIYSYRNSDAKKAANSAYQTLREQFSSRQRVNLTVILSIIIAVVYLIVLPPKSPVYTLVSGIIVMYGISMAAFVRLSSEEKLRQSLGLNDFAFRVPKKILSDEEDKDGKQ